MTQSYDDLDRTTSGRFVRNLAISLTGGALITLAGAAAAKAEPTETLHIDGEELALDVSTTATTTGEVEEHSSGSHAGTTLVLGGAAVEIALAGRRLLAARA